MPNKELKHTPLPWILINSGDTVYIGEKTSEGFNIIGNFDNKDNAYYALNCVNCHEELVEALELLKSRWDSTSPEAKNTSSYQIVEKALKKAKGN